MNDDRFQELKSQDELEWSDYGRSKRFPRGCFLLLACLFGIAVWVGIGYLIFGG